jgi:hypothetical protein
LYAYAVPDELSAGGGGWPWQLVHAPVAAKDLPLMSLWLWHDSQFELTLWFPPECCPEARNEERGM